MTNQPKLTPAQTRVLEAMQAGAKVESHWMTGARISGTPNDHPWAAATVLKALVRKGLAARAADKRENHTIWVYTLTDAGRAWRQ